VKRIWRPLVALAAAGALWAVVACLDISSPVSGILSITPIIVPTPSVVTGDSLRDTAGNVMPLQVIAFGANGDTVKDAVVRFFVVDTTHQLHVDSVRGVVWGDTLTSNGAVFARVTPAKGKGSLVTPLDTIPIIPVPVSAAADTNFVFAFDATATDTNAVSSISSPFGVTVRGNGGVAIQKYVVGFELVRAPIPKANDVGPTLLLISSLSTNDSTYAVTDATGHATLRLRLRLSATPRTLNAGGTDTAIVRFHVQYKGTPLQFTTPDSIIITIRAKIP
jgi:hypothetical protein